MGVSTFIIAGIIILASHFVSAIASFGSNILALPLLYLVTGDLQTAMFALLIVGTVQAYHILFYTIRDVDWRELRRMLFWVGLGLPIGITCIRYLPQKPLLVGLGLVLVFSGLSRLIPSTQTHAEIPSPVLKLLLFLGGIIHGSFVCGGATLVIYAQHTFKSKEAFRGTLCMNWVVLNTGLIALAILHRSFSAQSGSLALVGLPFVLLGNWAGEMVARRMDHGRFMAWVAVLLIIAGVVMVLRTLS